MSTSHWFDTERLETWLGEKLGGGSPVRVTKVGRISGGLSAETYLINAQLGAASDTPARQLVLRRDPVGGLVEREIEREYRVMECLADSAVPVPQVIGLELDPGWLERPFFVDEFRSGTADRNLFNSAAYADYRPSLGEQFVDYAAKMHTLDIEKSGLGFLENPGLDNAALQQVLLWEDLFRRNSQEPSPLLTEAFLWMKEHLPVAPRISLVHGEYRPGNFLFDRDRIISILDWEYAHLGDPLEDLGWAFLKLYRLGDLEAGFYRFDEFLERYQKAVGFRVDPAAVRFWQLFANVKGLAIHATGQKAFRNKVFHMPFINCGVTWDLSAEICRLMKL